MIKKAYWQETEFEGGEVSPREVGHNIYILALQVDSYMITQCCFIFRMTDIVFVKDGLGLSAEILISRCINCNASHFSIN